MNISNAPRQHNEHPENITFLLSSGKGFLKIQENVLACQTFKRAVQLHPCQHTNKNHGIALFKLKMYGEALQAFDRALKLEENNPEAHCGRGKTLLKLGRHKEAIQAFDQALAIKKDFPLANSGRQEALLHSGDYQGAIEAFNQILAIKKSPPAYLRRSWIFYKSGHYENAKNDALEALALDNTYCSAHYLLGRILIKLSQYSKAIEAFNKALAITKIPGAYLKRSWTFCKLGHYENAKNDALEALALDITGYDAHYWLGRSLIGLGQYAEAIEAFNKALAITKTPNGYTGIGKSLVGLDRYTEAIEAFDKALAINKDHQEAQRERANALLKLGLQADAKKEFDQAIKIQSNKPGSHEEHNPVAPLSEERDNQSPTVEDNGGEEIITALDIQISELYFLRDSSPKEEEPHIKRERDQKDLSSDQQIGAPAGKKRKTNFIDFQNASTN